MVGPEDLLRLFSESLRIFSESGGDIMPEPYGWCKKHKRVVCYNDYCDDFEPALPELCGNCEYFSPEEGICWPWGEEVSENDDACESFKLATEFRICRYCAHYEPPEARTMPDGSGRELASTRNSTGREPSEYIVHLGEDNLTETFKQIYKLLQHAKRVLGEVEARLRELESELRTFGVLMPDGSGRELRACYYMHPQPTSLRLATKAARVAGVRDQVVLDPFCGTGTCLVAAIRAGALKAIGSDVEDWSAYLRPELATILAHKPLCGREHKPVEIYWGLDALEAVATIEHDVLFTDPPNPWTICGGVCLSALRFLRMGFTELRHYWREHLSPQNLMGKGVATIKHLFRLLALELQQGKRIIINLFDTSPQAVKKNTGKKSLARVVASLFHIKPLGVGYWHEVLGIKDGRDHIGHITPGGRDQEHTPDGAGVCSRVCAGDQRPSRSS